MKNITGPPVYGNDFFDREPQINQFWDRIKSGHHVLITAPRRVGKTSLMLQIREKPLPCYSIIYLNTESVNNENEFYRRLLNSVLKTNVIGKTEKVRSTFQKSIPEIKKIGKAGIEFGARDKHNYFEILTRVFSSVNDIGVTLIIMLDEFPVTLENIIKDESAGAGRKFLGSHRELRQDPVISKNIRFVYTGSIGLENIVNRINLAGNLMDLSRLSIPPFTQELAEKFIDRLSENYNFEFNTSAKKHIIHRIQWLNPFYLQLIVWELKMTCPSNHEVITPKMIDCAFYDMLKQRSYFEHWYDRLRKSLEGDEHNFAKELLNIASENNTIHSNEIFDLAEKYKVTDSSRDILSSLKYDGYIDNGDNPKVYRFNSPVVKEWWRKNVAN